MTYCVEGECGGCGVTSPIKEKHLSNTKQSAQSFNLSETRASQKVKIFVIPTIDFEPQRLHFYAISSVVYVHSKLEWFANKMYSDCERSCEMSWPDQGTWLHRRFRENLPRILGTIAIVRTKFDMELMYAMFCSKQVGRSCANGRRAYTKKFGLRRNL